LFSKQPITQAESSRGNKCMTVVAAAHARCWSAAAKPEQLYPCTKTASTTEGATSSAVLHITETHPNNHARLHA
jgi:hypothetical protein